MVLRLRDSPPDKWDEAKCLQFKVSRDNDPFFSEDEEESQEAANFCNGEADGIICPIREQCLLFALVNNERYGVWGGSSEVTRKAIRKKYPSRGGRRNESWTWMSESAALKGLRKEELLMEEEDEE